MQLVRFGMRLGDSHCRSLRFVRFEIAFRLFYTTFEQLVFSGIAFWHCVLSVLGSVSPAMFAFWSIFGVAFWKTDKDQPRVIKYSSKFLEHILKRAAFTMLPVFVIWVSRNSTFGRGAQTRPEVAFCCVLAAFRLRFELCAKQVHRP